MEPWGEKESLNNDKSWEKLSYDKAQELLSNEIDSPLTVEQEKEIDSIVEEAERKLFEHGLL